MNDKCIISNETIYLRPGEGVAQYGISIRRADEQPRVVYPWELLPICPVR